MKTLNSNADQAQNEETLKAGVTIIWDKTLKQPIGEFVDTAMHGLPRMYGYDFIVFGYAIQRKQTRLKTPTLIAVCRGYSALDEVFQTLSNSNIMYEPFQMAKVQNTTL